MYCTQCGYNNPAHSQFCKNCELDLAPDASSNLHKTEMRIYAGFWRRFLAAFLDLLVIFTGVIFMLIAIVGLIAVSGRDDIVHNNLALWIFYCALVAWFLAYYIFLASGEQCATFGKRWMGIQVVDLAGNRLTALRALGRLVAIIFSLLLLCIGFLIQPFTPRKQATHDLLAKTIVVQTDESRKVSIMATLLVLFFALMVPLLALFSTAGLPVFQQYIQKVQLEKGMQTGTKATSSVAKFYRSNGRVPVTISEADAYLGSTSHISAIDINQQNGEITLTFSGAERKALRNKHLLFTPALGADHSISWACHSNDIEAQILPVTCK